MWRRGTQLQFNVYFWFESILVSFVGPAKSNAAQAKQYLDSKDHEYFKS
jgi:hypothetical protein